MAWNPDEAPQRLPQSHIFKENTKAFGRRRTISLIDGMLDVWYEEPTLENTIGVYKTCRLWLKSKDGKTSNAANRRRGEVNLVIAGAIQWINHLDPDLGRAFEVFHRRKADHGGYEWLKPMADPYLNERETYLNSDKETAISGSLIDQKSGLNSVRNALGINQDFDNLSEDQWHQIDEHFVNEDLSVVYLKKMERLRYMLLIDNGFLRTIDWQLHSSAGDQGWPFAMDSYGNLFTTDDEAQAGQFNHSSFNAGKPVVCAGFLKVDHGQLIKINNNSGHYKPSLEELDSAVRLLERAQVFLNGVIVEYWDYETNPDMKLIWNVSIDELRDRDAFAGPGRPPFRGAHNLVYGALP